MTGIRKSMVGKATIQDAIHDSIQRTVMPGSKPIARTVAMPETMRVMTKVSANGRAICIVRAGSFFTAGRTIWYGLRPRPSLP